MRRSDIVVGVDGSLPSWDAMHWAVVEARHWRAELHVVIVDDEKGPPTQRPCDSRLAQMVTDVRRLEPAVRVTGHLVRGRVVPALREAAGRGRMLVVGNRGTGGFGPLTFGSTSQQIAAHATVPVVVVRGRHGPVDSPIVIGVDGSLGGEHALAAGLDEARLRGCEVIVTFAYGRADHPWLEPGEGRDSRLVRCSAYASLDSLVAPWRDKFPRLSIEVAVAAEQPAPVLLALSRNAQLVVVGAHGHDDPVGLMGSIPLKLLHRAHCPVMVVR